MLGLGAWTVACGEDPRAEEDDVVSPGTSTASDTSGTPTSTTGDGASSSGDAQTSVGPGTETTGTVEPACERLVCGSECCETTEDCVDGTCLPTCTVGVRCGAAFDECCDAGQVCLADACTSPGAACADAYDCEAGEFCEPTLGQCLPQPEDVSCEVVPELGDFEATIEWSFETDEVISMPAVADVDGDGEPEVVIGTFGVGGIEFQGEIVVLDGTSGVEQFRITHDPVADQYGSYGRSTVGLADVDGDARPDIVYAGRPEVAIAPFANNSSLIHAVDGTGERIWSSHAPDGSPYYIYVRHGAPAFANLDDDDASEVIFGSAVLDDDGTVVFDQAVFIGTTNYGGGISGSNGNYLGGISTAADLDGDGYPEIISGRQAWSVDWNAGGGTPSVDLTLFWEHAGPDGFPAVADLDLDGDPEVVLVGDPAPFTTPADGTLTILDGATGALWCGVDPTGGACDVDPGLRTAAVPLYGGGRGGPPTVADFDGDGRPEIGVAGASAYAVYDLNREGEDVVVPPGDPAPAAGGVYSRWRSTTQDESSNTTGSSVFDFQGDGAAEVVYGDECYVRVYDGASGNVLFEEENSTSTIHEYPIVVDVDGDGNSELLVVANDSDAGNTCGAIPGYTPRRGVFAYGDPNDRWVRTRRVWTSHTYHVTNATADGLTPSVLNDNWDNPELNNFRQNFQGLGVFNAPDLTVDVSASLFNCQAEEIEIITTVRNVGSAGVEAGIEVRLYRGTDATGELVGTQSTPTPLLPGADVDLSWVEPSMTESQDYFVDVDAPETAAECNEDNNAAVVLALACPIAG